MPLPRTQPVATVEIDRVWRTTTGIIHYRIRTEHGFRNLSTSTRSELGRLLAGIELRPPTERRVP